MFQLFPVAFVSELRLEAQKVAPVPSVQLFPVASVSKLRLFAQKSTPVFSGEILPATFVCELGFGLQKCTPILTTELIPGTAVGKYRTWKWRKPPEMDIISQPFAINAIPRRQNKPPIPAKTKRNFDFFFGGSRGLPQWGQAAAALDNCRLQVGQMRCCLQTAGVKFFRAAAQSRFISKKNLSRS